MILPDFVRNTARTLHRFGFVRKVGKSWLVNSAVSQPFYGGEILLDAVQHSWAWTGDARCETFDVELQETLLARSRSFPHLIDIGCNVGAMTLSVLLRNPSATGLCIDPNERATNLLQQSLSRNGVENRAEVVSAAVGDVDGELRYDATGSVSGHVSQSGRPVRQYDFAALLNRASTPALVKIDVEGYETVLMKRLTAVRDLRFFCFVVELHPAGFNEWGDPKAVVRLLESSRARLGRLDGGDLGDYDEHGFTQVVAIWS